MTQKALVIGGSGFLGGHLIQALTSVGMSVHASSRRWRESTESVRWWQADVANHNSADRLLQSVKPDLVFHLASHGWGAPGREHLQPTLRNDLMASLNTLVAALDHRPRRLILVGSLEEPQSGDADLVPSSPYAAAKSTISAYARMLHRLYGLPVAIGRVFMAYGPRQHQNKVMARAIIALRDGKRLEISEGERQLDWVYVEDAVKGLLAVAAADDVDGRTIDIGSGRVTSIREVVLQLGEIAGHGTAMVFKDAGLGSDRPIRVANVDETMARTGWRATTPLAEGLQRTFSWYQRQEDAALAST